MIASDARRVGTLSGGQVRGGVWGTLRVPSKRGGLGHFQGAKYARGFGALSGCQVREGVWGTLRVPSTRGGLGPSQGPKYNVGAERIELSTNGLRVRCSTS